VKLLDLISLSLSANHGRPPNKVSAKQRVIEQIK
jgi:hypothetical protein